jgi:hypothetical protein
LSAVVLGTFGIRSVVAQETATDKATSAVETQSPAPPPAPVPAPALAPAPAPTDDQQGEISPTADSDAYELAKKNRIIESGRPNWAVNLTIVPIAFKSTDIRQPPAPVGSVSTTDTNPTISGGVLGWERFLLNKAGVLSFGLQFGFFGGSGVDFGNLWPTYMTLMAYLQYEFVYADNQWVVPTIKGGYDETKYKFAYLGNNTSGMRGLPRGEVGLMVLLNNLDRDAANNLFNNVGIKRTYLAVYYSYERDSNQKDINLTEESWRFGFRFEY